MNNVFIISDSDFYSQANKISEKLSVGIISYQNHENEMGFHDWITREIMENDVKKIIIPLSLPYNAANVEGLLLGLHIRLNYEIPLERRIIPIVFISNLSISNIVTKSTFDNDNNPQNLLFTQGIAFSSTDIDEIKETLCKVSILEAKDYRNFLKQLNIHRKTHLGHHDIANAWGCYKLARVVGVSDMVFSKESIAKHLKQLYAKYLICVNESYGDSKMSYVDLQPINCSGRRILFVDDKSDEGWGDLMSKIFKSAGNGLVCVDSSKYKVKGDLTDYEGFITECKSYIGQRWDLIIIDIRLNPNLEDADSNNIVPTEFSGYKLIDEFLKKNEGYQIIVSTASNKIWNVNETLKRGAKGYYIKESPEFNYPVSETKRQYEILKGEIKRCFENSYLQDIFKSMEEDIKPCLPQNAFGRSISKQLDLAFYLISKAETKEQFAFAYVSLYLVLEIVNKHFVTRDADDKWMLPCGQYIMDWTFDKGSNQYCNSGNIKVSNDLPEWLKLAGIIFQQWGLHDQNQLVKNIYFQIRKRNGFIHNDNTIIDDFNNHDIYNKDGFVALFNSIKVICSHL